jgi:hypothetical protein
MKKNGWQKKNKSRKKPTASLLLDPHRQVVPQ